MWSCKARHCYSRSVARSVQLLCNAVVTLAGYCVIMEGMSLLHNVLTQHIRESVQVLPGPFSIFWVGAADKTISILSRPSLFPSFLSPSLGTLHALSPTTQPTPPPAPPPLITNCTFHQPQTSVTGSGPSKSKLLRSSSGKRGRSSPTLNSQKKSQFVLVAAEAVPLTAAGNYLFIITGAVIYTSVDALATGIKIDF